MSEKTRCESVWTLSSKFKVGFGWNNTWVEEVCQHENKNRKYVRCGTMLQRQKRGTTNSRKWFFFYVTLMQTWLYVVPTWFMLNKSGKSMQDTFNYSSSYSYLQIQGRFIKLRHPSSWIVLYLICLTAAGVKTTTRSQCLSTVRVNCGEFESKLTSALSNRQMEAISVLFYIIINIISRSIYRHRDIFDRAAIFQVPIVLYQINTNTDSTNNTVVTKTKHVSVNIEMHLCI